MKPQFALDLSHTSIRLLHLAGSDEVELGHVALDDPDFDMRVHDLYRLAEERSKGRVRSLLLIPNSEVLYTRVPTGKGDRAARAQAVSEALVGMTPYALDELKYDWRVDGDEAVVAAVARLTLQEAEDFAVARGFNPLGFSSRPVNGAFKGTPDFGTTALAQARKDGAPWPAPPEPPAPAPVAKPEAEAVTSPEPGPETATEPVPEPIADPAAAATTDPGADTADTAVAEPAESDAPSDAGAAGDLEPDIKADAGPDIGAAPLPSLPDADPVDRAAPAAMADLALDVPPAPMALDVDPEFDLFPADPAEPQADLAAPDLQAAPQTDPQSDPGPQFGFAPLVSAETSPDALAALTPGAAISAPELNPDPDAALDTHGAVAQPDSPASDSAESDSDTPTAATGPRKRGAGRASAAKGRKGKDKAAEASAPAFASRRTAAPAKALDPLSPPPRPAGLPPITTLESGTPPPPRPKIPPHLAKSVPGPNRPAAGKPAAPVKAPKNSRLAQLMARLQNEPDGGSDGAAERSTLAPIPDLPKSIEAKAPPRPNPRASATPIHDLPVPRPSAPPPKAPPLSGGLPDPGTASASLTPDRKPATGTPLPPPRGLTRDGLDEAQAMTLFGARSDKRERSLAPVMIGIAVALLLAVAVWAGVLLLGREPATPTATESNALDLETAGREIAAVEDAGDLPVIDPAQVPDLAPRPPLADAPVLASPDDIAAPPALGGSDTGPNAGPAVAAAPVVASAPSPDIGLGPQETAQPLPDPATRDAAVSRYAALGIWQIAPDPPGLPDTGSIDDLRLASLTGTTTFDTIAALAPPPDLSSLVPPPLMTPPAPPPADQIADPVIETEAPPDAALAATGPQQTPSPEGVRVTAGAPVVVPPQRPDRPARLRDIVPVNPADGPDLRPLQRPTETAEQQDTALDAAAPVTTADATPTADATGRAPAAGIASLVPETALAGAAPEIIAPLDVAPLADSAAQPALQPDTLPDGPDDGSAVEIAVATPADSDLRPRARPGNTADVVEAVGPTPLRPAERPQTVARAETDIGPTAALTAEAADTASQASAVGILRAPSPPARPASFASLVTAAAPDPVADPEADLAQAAADPATDDALPASPYAVIRSMKPEARPKNLERQVARVRTQTGPPVAAVASVKPTAPTTATVAKTATETNVLNLARLNLIGVYGGTSDRRALIRLPSGRFVKVEVGDRLDGGRVATISDGALRYVKGGRNITLQIPG